ncbi:MAG: NUDIX hydrolase [Jatrophihabitans sp.]
MAEKFANTIRAAGGVVWRIENRRVLVALVHRPRYDDWSLPKGKLEPGESELEAAVREVGEEIGSHVTVSRRITRISYPVAGARKTVTFWVMQHVDGCFVTGDEVDEIMWAPVKAARSRLTHKVEKRVLDEFAAVPIPDSTILLVRHAKAGKRSEWRGDDDLRPLEPSGVEQAERLRAFLPYFGPDAVVSANPLRCVQTVTPLADDLGLAVTIDPVFADASYARSPADTEAAFLSLAKPRRVTVVCGQGLAIASLVDSFVRGVRDADTKKGAVWALSVVDGSVVSGDYYEDARR